MTETKTSETGDGSSAESGGGGLSRSEWVGLILGVGNFLLVTVLGAYTSWRTQDLESRLSTLQTAGEYIRIVADGSAPDYAKGMALNAIFNQGLLSRDQLLDAAYRIEDDSLERTMVGQIFYRLASLEERLESPFGYVEDVVVREGADGRPELAIRGWGVDDSGWLSGPMDGRNQYLVVEVNDELVCTYPGADEVGCTVTFGDRPDIFAAFPQYPQSKSGGFEVTFPINGDAVRALHLVIALRDKDHRGRIIYSRCVGLPEGEVPGAGQPGAGHPGVGEELRLAESRYEHSRCRPTPE